MNRLEVVCRGLTRSVCRRYPGLDPDEVRSEVNQQAAVAVARLRPGYDLAGWVWFFVSRRLSKAARPTWRRRWARPAGGVPRDRQARPAFDVAAFVAGLTPGAMKAVTLAFWHETRAGVREALREEGWTWKEIQKVWREIQEALS